MGPKYVKTIICLANSRKDLGRCVAGKELIGAKPGAWIRPISKRPNGEVSEEERRFEDGRDPKLLDIVAVPMIEPRPHNFQSENHLIDDGYYWTKTGVATWNDVQAAIDRIPGALWDNSTRSSNNGLNDRVEESLANKLDSSLRLVQVSDLEIAVALEGAGFPNAKRKVRGRFTLNGVRYWLAVTDPIVERQYLAGPNGEFSVGDAVLCISLGEPYNCHAYKLIAGVFLPP